MTTTKLHSALKQGITLNTAAKSQRALKDPFFTVGLKKVVATVEAIQNAIADQEHFLSVGGEQYRLSDYAFPVSVTKLIHSSTVFITSNGRYRTQPVAKVVNTPGDEELFNPSQVKAFFDFVNDGLRNSVVLSPVVDDTVMTLDQIGTITINNQSYYTADGYTREQEIVANLLSYELAVDLTVVLTPCFHSVTDIDVAQWLVSGTGGNVSEEG